MKKLAFLMEMPGWEKCLVLLPAATANLLLLGLYWFVLIPRTLAIRMPSAEEWAGAVSCTLIFFLGFVRGASRQLDARAGIHNQATPPIAKEAAQHNLRIKAWQLTAYILVLAVASAWLPPNIVVKFGVFWSCIFLTDISNSFANHIWALRAVEEEGAL